MHKAKQTTDILIWPLLFLFNMYVEKMEEDQQNVLEEHWDRSACKGVIVFSFYIATLPTFYSQQWKY